MIVCDYCGKDCLPDHADFKLEAYQWSYNLYSTTPQNTLHLHRRCYEEIIDTIRLQRISMTLTEAENLLKLHRDKEFKNGID